MADSAQYKIELVSAESDSGESTVVRGITYKPNNAARRQKNYRRPIKDAENCDSFKRFGISVCILLTSAVILWILVLSLLLAELFKRSVELQRITGRTSAQTEELTNEIHGWHNFSKSMEKGQNLHAVQIAALEREWSNLTARLGKLEKRLVAVEEKESRPQLFRMVQEQVSTLTSSVAGLSSEVESLKSKLTGFRDDEDNESQILSNLQMNLTNLVKTVTILNKTICDEKSRISDRPANSSTIMSQAIENISPKINELNESLSKRLRYLSEDQERDHKLFLDLQESLANVSSQVISLLQTNEVWKTNFNNMELKILTIREQFKAFQTKPHETVSRRLKMESKTSALCADDTTTARTSSTESPTIMWENQPSTLIGTTAVSPEVDIPLSVTPKKFPATS